MIIGQLEIHDGTVSTHRDSYALEQLTVVSVRRPLLAPALMSSIALGAPCVAFADLIMPHEVAALLLLTAALLAVGSRAACLKLLSRDLRGSELGEVVWGDVGRLNRERRRIVEAMRSTKT